jgi:hypothetical protein
METAARGASTIMILIVATVQTTDCHKNNRTLTMRLVIGLRLYKDGARKDLTLTHYQLPASIAPVQTAEDAYRSR